jgi:hypothetical protein
VRDIVIARGGGCSTAKDGKEITTGLRSTGRTSTSAEPSKACRRRSAKWRILSSITSGAVAVGCHNSPPRNIPAAARIDVGGCASPRPRPRGGRAFASAVRPPRSLLNASCRGHAISCCPRCCPEFRPPPPWRKHLAEGRPVLSARRFICMITQRSFGAFGRSYRSRNCDKRWNKANSSGFSSGEIERALCAEHKVSSLLSDEPLMTERTQC